MREDDEFGRLIDPSRVGAAGFSIGGMTALALGGARIAPAHYDAFCKATPSDGVCQKPPEMPGMPDIDRATGIAMLGLSEAQVHAGENTALPGLRSVLSVAPPTQMFDPASFAALRVPVVIIIGAADTIVTPIHHGALAAAEIKGAKLVSVPAVAHYSFLSICTDAARAEIDACKMAPNQETAHQIAIDEALELFHRTLGVAR